MHGTIEHAEKHITITSMRQWLTVFSMARSNGNRHKLIKEKCAFERGIQSKGVKVPRL